ncbi:MAG: diguanylate cyclase with GAF sensor [uncultured bacterium]|uniref:GGDEF domain-containing protein n=1 Tax=Candidatus Wallbacteria bacterium GWC2_49_35 TaxID=1817813 RepID=A0A1F7WH60_9BACT|nr:MAG: diguanylate cyclase with GAF sensor [uncultured bacterium]OGM01739.1 MAG: hypothetical protein A2008_00325 [Candidatus Wallbacteria bacterium GWC2_49_35]HBC74655.1 hypothetical protein [Candidatus Wallbacteria bacterium]
MIKRTETFIFLIITITVCVLFFFNYFEPLEVKTQDFRFKRNINQSVSKDVVLVTINEDDEKNYGPWPFKRSVHARLVDYLKDAGAAVIGFDIIFSLNSEDASDDETFTRAIRSAGNVILANRIVHSERIIDTKTFHREEALEAPMEGFRSAALGTGFVNVDFENLNPDGVIRNVEFLKEINGTIEASLALKTAVELMKYKTGRSFGIESDAGNITAGYTRIPIFNYYTLGRSGVKKSAAYMVKFNGNSTTGLFPAYSYTDIFNSTEKELPKSVFKGKAVIVGAQSQLLPDIKLSPLGTIPGMEINAQIVDNIVSEDFVIRPARSISAVIVILLGVLIFYFLIRNEPAFIDIAYLAFFVALVLGTTYLLYSNFMILFEIVTPLAEILILFIATRFYQLFIKLYFTNIDLKISNRKLEQKVAELSALYGISKTITTITDMKALFKIILEKTIDIVNAGNGFIMMADEEDGTFKNRIALEGDETPRKDFEPLYAEVLKNKKSVIYNLGGGRDEKIKLLFAANPDLRSIMAIPLTTYKGDLAGVIILANKKDGDIFSENDIQLTSVIATQAGFAIENATLYQLAVFDSLTSLYVRRYFLGVAVKEFKRIRRYGGSLSLLMTDIDHFKKFNDTYGHQIGDLVLKSVAGVVRKSVRETDIAARYGGEEFIMLLPETDSAGALIFAERLRKSIETSVFESERGALKVTISIGASSFVVDRLNKNNAAQYKDMDEMIKCADIALYNSKEAGRNATTIYTAGMKSKVS